MLSLVLVRQPCLKKSSYLHCRVLNTLIQTPSPVVKVSNANHAKTLGQVEITFTLANQVFTEKFLLSPLINNPIQGLPYRNNKLLIDVASQKTALA